MTSLNLFATRFDQVQGCFYVLFYGAVLGDWGGFVYVESQRSLCLVSLLIFLGSYSPYRTMYFTMLSEHASFHTRDFSCF